MPKFLCLSVKGLKKFKNSAATLQFKILNSLIRLQIGFFLKNKIIFISDR